MNDALSARDQAHTDQLAASDPAVSAFVGASAGSGKTKLLTDRLLRLMLGGARPERIQCLTFTKAAAAEMALRLQRTLGRWVTLPDAELDAALRNLAITPTPALRAHARALFATVLDLPGGMRIGTIHAFCQSLLRRFPLEAALSPHFELADERDADAALLQARETMLARAAAPEMRAALERLAGLTSADHFGRLVAALQSDRKRLAAALGLGAGLAAAQRRALAIGVDTETDLIAQAVNWQAERTLRQTAECVLRDGSPKFRDKAERLLGWLGLETRDRIAHWNEWLGEFLLADGTPRKDGAFLNKKLAATAPAFIAAFQAEVTRVADIQDARRGLAMAEVSHALVTLAAPVLDAYTRRKDETGLLDYDDLIGRTQDLLVDPGAAWVLYKLDGGLDHLLLDEVQDTAPAQWRIAHALTAEFFAGSGARDVNRTVFAVGDRKQSIYSFQGADIDAFNRSRALLARRAREAGQSWIERPLDVSFRSTTPVLALVDAVFAAPLAAAGVCEPGTLAHIADRAGHAGAVELWPLTPPPPENEPPAWSVPSANQGLTSAPHLLAEALARRIAAETNGSVMLESRGRRLRPGDVMVLVRRRNDFARCLLRELKRHGVPVAGLDRLVLTEQPAVQDLMALADALLLPPDDLTLACFLTSPLGGLADASLMELAIDRPGNLWDALRTRAHERPDWHAAATLFTALLARVDYATPHALLAEALGPLGGRARLFARLGAEAGEPVDELLNAALTYARRHPPSLQGFLHWLRGSGADVKREQEAGGEVVRIMTVHGAKGLQAPLVILPDTTALPPEDGTVLWGPDPATGREVPLWAPRKELRCAAGEQLRAAVAAKRLEEHNRLLYVALTRAEDRLLICGWEPRRGVPDTCWYSLVRQGFAAIGAGTQQFDAWPGEALRHAASQTVAPRPEPPGDTGPPPELPVWAGRAPDWRPAPPPAEPTRPEPLAPSRPTGVELGPVPAAASPLSDGVDRFRRGRLIHTLLQHLPDLPPDRRQAAAAAWLDRPGHGLPEGEAVRIGAELAAILDHPNLAPLFGPESRAEVPLSGMVGNKVVGGLVDRLAVLPDRIMVADFKTNRRAPASAADTPVMYLRQMAAYRAVLRQVFPNRPVQCTLVWTHATQVTPLPDALLDAHAPC